MADRQAFLDHVREQAAKGRAYRVAVNPHATHTQSYVGCGPDKVGALLTEWQGVGGEGTRVSGWSAARAWVSQFVLQHSCQRIIHWQHEVLDRLDVGRVCRDAGCDVWNWGDLARDAEATRWQRAFAADLGITSVDWAIAETGSLALFAQPDQGRVVSLLPKRYLAIIEPGQILPDLFDLFARLEERKSALPSNMVLVTGPSKTGDIELKLTTGVHGPGNVHLLVVENDAEPR